MTPPPKPVVRWLAWHAEHGPLGPSLSKHRTLSVGYRDNFCQSEANRREWPVVRVEIRPVTVRRIRATRKRRQ